ncbi:MAG: DEAD/DEAH box helicase [Myxococcales bacterium]|nr:DEAD/DEAH box helicase [Myxococcales bacterium]
MEFSAPVAAWFARRFPGPTESQRQGWPAIASGRDTLIAAPTGSGKTLAAFLVLIDRLVRRALAGELTDGVDSLYVSPLRALSNDIHRNLEVPLAEIREEATRLGLDLPEIRAAVRTGDTSSRQRQSMIRKPPHILVTTPESLFLLVTAERSRATLRSARTVIVDEIHALARDKRGSHLALTLERLEALCDTRPVRIGLSATQRPIEGIADFLGGERREVGIVDLGHQRDLELGIELPEDQELQAVASKEQWDELLDQIAERVESHRTTLVFVNTRRLAERVTHRLQERLGDAAVAAHHGSLSKDRRLRVEDRLRDGELRAIVATASLELGIDIGTVELVCQIGSPRSIATFLQRVGRSGHSLGLRPSGRLFPTTRDELLECAALLRAVKAGRLDRIFPPRAPLDILAQQLVAACAVEEWSEDELYRLVRRAAPFRELSRERFDAVLELLARGYETARGRRAVYLHRDRLLGRIRGRRSARITALTSGGAIPDVATYRVLLDPDDTFIGTVDEDWAIESMPGDVFLLGTHSWKIRRVESAVVRVTDAHGSPPTIPFWQGEAPARTGELSREVSDLRRDLALRLREGLEAAADWLTAECELGLDGARQLARYVEAQSESAGVVPTCDDLLAERFFDDSGGMQLVVHSPYGGRINRGFGLALRKRFCQGFNQELQAAATDDAIVLSLGTPQTFPLETLSEFLSPDTVGDLLEQALLASPMFTARWRWNANRSLAVPRMRGGRKVPYPIQRMQADDLLTAAFPDQVACQENLSYPIEIPDHPMVAQTLYDCLHEACDLDGLRELVSGIRSGKVRLHVLDSVEPSPFSHEVLSARPYAFLDDAPLEERRTRAVSLRHVLPESARDLARLDPEAIERVRREAAPVVRDADELYEFLLDLVLVRERDLGEGRYFVAELEAGGRTASADGELRFAAENLPRIQRLLPDAEIRPALELPDRLVREGADADPEAVRESALRGHLAILGPVSERDLAARLACEASNLRAPLARLEARGVILRGHFDPGADTEQFCDRGLLARIHRYTLARLRKEIEPVSARDYLRFLLRWQHLHPESRLRGEGGMLRVIEQLAGFEAPVGAWEPELLAARIEGYRPESLDALCLSGRVAWGRISSVSEALEPGTRPSRATPVGLFPRDDLDALLYSSAADGGPGRWSLEADSARRLCGPAEKILELLRARGALFSREITPATRLLPVQVEEGLRELIARGIVSCDGFAPLRKLLLGSSSRRARLSGLPSQKRPRNRIVARGVQAPEGRWGLLSPLADPPDPDELIERAAHRLLDRYGVVFRDGVARENLPAGWREIHRALRRLEARGVVRGGRFVSGFVGEQFALPEAIPALRRERRRDPDGVEIRVSASDPVNLAGILTPGGRVAAGHTRALVFRDGLPIAIVEKGKRRELGPGAESATG